MTKPLTKAEETAENLIAVAKEVAIQLKARTDSDIEMTKETIASEMQRQFNGKMDTLKITVEDIQTNIAAHNAKHEADMEELKPIIASYRESREFANSARASGKVILWLAGFVVAVGSAWLILVRIFTGVHTPLF